MERIAIIDHESHQLFVEDVSEETLAKYNGEEEAYIKDNYKLDGEWSWDYIRDAQYIPEDEDCSYQIDFEDLTD